MNVVDSCGWLEYFADGPNASFFAPALEDTLHLLVPTVCVYEVFKKVHAERGRDAALQAVALMRQGRELPLDFETALAAATWSRELRLPLADSFVYASARAQNAAVWTQDEHFAGLDHVRYKRK